MAKHVTNMTIYDVDHYTDEEREAIIQSYPEHEREARAKGIPMLGSGRVYPIAEERIKCDPMPIPAHWPQINGLDFGFDHPFAASNLAWDRDFDRIYVTKGYRESGQIPLIHSGALKPWGAWIPCAWPHDGLQHDKGSGMQLKEQYASHGLNMLHEHATHPEGGFGVEAGIAEILERMQTDRFKVFSTLDQWFEEFRMYHRLDGKIVKEREDLLDSTRVAVMMMRFAKVKPTGTIKAPNLGTIA